MIHKRKLTIAVAATAIALAIVPNAEGQYIRTSFNAKPIISGPIVPVVPRMPIIMSPSQWTINNPTLNPTLSALPTVAPAPVITPARTIMAISAIIPARAVAAISVAAPAAVPIEIPISQAAPAVQQSALSNIFDGKSVEGKAEDIAGLVNEIRSNINAQTGKLRQSIASDNEKRTKSLIPLNKGQSTESEDYIITLEEIRVTPDGAGSAHLKVRNKHSKEVIDLYVGNDESRMFTITNVKERWQKVFSVRANMSDQFGAVALDIQTVMKSEIYTMAKKSKVVALGVGGHSELGAGGFEIVEIKGDKVKIYFGHGETEFEKWFTLGQERKVVFEEDDYYQTFKLKIIRITTKNGKQTVKLRINE